MFVCRNFCVECACLRNNCPVTRYQKRRLRFQKMQQQQQQQSGSVSPLKRFHTKFGDKPPLKLTIKSPVKSPSKSPIKATIKTPEKPSPEVITATSEVLDSSLPAPSPAKMIRRSQVSSSAGRVRALRVPSQVRYKLALNLSQNSCS